MEIRQLVYQAILNIAPEVEAELRDDARLVADLGLESVQLLELAGEMERQFRLQIMESDLMGIDTVEDLIEALQRFAA